ncbi:RidA family protein [Paraburkholderia sp. J10-1]|uniref:RidA family protein n=1 Tax=Paraburkholderia sp. J10-1 TaxID=2805430 RepID=UPI002AB65B3F|nr:RidA family protein [Paraburkholderia sp. J10-1]
MSEIARLGVGPRASGIVVSGDRLETSGIVADPGVAHSIEDQTRSVLAQLESLLKQAGACKANVTRIQIWLADMKDFDAMNRIYDGWVGNADQPARACVGAELAHESYLIEIQASGTL